MIYLNRHPNWFRGFGGWGAKFDLSHRLWHWLLTLRIALPRIRVITFRALLYAVRSDHIRPMIELREYCHRGRVTN